MNISILNLTKPLWVSTTCFKIRKIRKCFVTVSVTTQIESALNIYFSENQILIIPFDEIFIVERFKGTFRRGFGTLTIKLLDFGSKVKSLQVSCLIRRLVYRVSGMLHVRDLNIIKSLLYEQNGVCIKYSLIFLIKLEIFTNLRHFSQNAIVNIDLF